MQDGSVSDGYRHPGYVPPRQIDVELSHHPGYSPAVRWRASYMAAGGGWVTFSTAPTPNEALTQLIAAVASGSYRESLGSRKERKEAATIKRPPHRRPAMPKKNRKR